MTDDKTDDKTIAEPQSFSIPVFCARHNICKSTFHKMKNAGRAPRIMYLGKVQRITLEAERDWIEAREHPTAYELERIEHDAAERVAHTKRIGKLAVASPLHPCRKPDEQRAAVRKAKLAAQEAERLAREARDAWRREASKQNKPRKARHESGSECHEAK